MFSILKNSRVKGLLARGMSALVAAAFALGLASGCPWKASAAASGSTAAQVALSSGTLNVRAGAGTGYAVVSSLANGTLITVASSSNGWSRVEYAAGKTGYVSAAYIRGVSGSYAAKVSLSYGSLNVRGGAGTGYGVLTRLANGTGVVVLSSSGGWSRILYNGVRTGYVSGEYLKPFSSAAYPAVSLSVPSYKQTDSRWSGVALGTQGKTIATAGCLTTALAMSESYRTGTTVTPAAMASRLTYMADGTAYWPANYSFSTASGWMSMVYQRLKAGKTTLVGAKNAYGSQHWVVVTGYTGGSSLTTAGFTVNDPGSNSRTTLQQYLNAYPNFYKLAYAG